MNSRNSKRTALFHNLDSCTKARIARVLLNYSELYTTDDLNLAFRVIGIRPASNMFWEISFLDRFCSDILCKRNAQNLFGKKYIKQQSSAQSQTFTISAKTPKIEISATINPVDKSLNLILKIANDIINNLQDYSYCVSLYPKNPPLNAFQSMVTIIIEKKFQAHIWVKRSPYLYQRPQISLEDNFDQEIQESPVRTNTGNIITTLEYSIPLSLIVLAPYELDGGGITLNIYKKVIGSLFHQCEPNQSSIIYPKRISFAN